MGSSYSEFKSKYNGEYYDRFDYCKPEIEPNQTSPENMKNLKTPEFVDFGTSHMLFRRTKDWQAGILSGIAEHASPHQLSKMDNNFFVRQALNMQPDFVNYTTHKAWVCSQTYENSSAEMCANEFKRHLFLVDKEMRWKYGSLIVQHGIDPIARIPEHLKYESDEFKIWLEQNAMSFIFPLYLHDYAKELNEY